MNPNPPPPPSPMSAAAPGAQPPMNTLAVVSLVMAIIGTCLLCIGPIVAAVLGTIALFKIKGTNQRGAALAVVALCIAALVAVSHLGIALAIAVPNFVKFQSKAKQSECKTNLMALHTAQLAFFAEHDRYSENPEELGFAPSKPHHYSYFLSAQESGWVLGGEKAARSPDLELATIGVQGECPECAYTAMCASNLDTDAGDDVWVISSEDMEDAAGVPVPAGTAHNIVSDIDAPRSSRGGGSSWDD